jgi:hypothetical protein
MQNIKPIEKIDEIKIQQPTDLPVDLPGTPVVSDVTPSDVVAQPVIEDLTEEGQKKVNDQLVMDKKYFVKVKRPSLFERVEEAKNMNKRKKITAKTNKQLASKLKATRAKNRPHNVKANSAIPISEKKKMIAVGVLLIGFYLLVDAKILLPDVKVPFQFIKDGAPSKPPVDATIPVDVLPPPTNR